MDILQKHHITYEQNSIKVEALETKHTIYASFHVAVNVSTDVINAAFGVLLIADAWPTSAMVCHYFQPCHQ